MREERSITGDTTIVGMGEYLEIWNSAAWHSEQGEIDESYGELLQALADSLEPSNHNEDSP